MNENEKESDLEEEEIITEVEEIVNEVWAIVHNKFGDRLSQDNLNNLFAALGVVAGMGLTESYEVDPLFPFHLQGVLNDFTYQTMYSSKYGIDFSELEYLKENPH